LTRFFAASWKGRQCVAQEDVQAIQSEYQSKLGRLSQTLPSRFREKLDRVCAELPLLFMPTYPLALNHGDLCEMNILVNSDTGHITGAIDWAEAQISPFGISLWGLENVLGSMNHLGWHYHPQHHSLRELFWKTFEVEVGGISEHDKKAIQIARMAGLFLHYGFDWVDGSYRPTEEGTSSFKYLNAFCASDS